MNEASVSQYIVGTFADVETTENFGYTFFFYREDHLLPFATIASTDNEYETISNLSRPDVFRLNVGVSPETFRSLFGAQPVDPSRYDFTALDTILPHPDYAPQFFVCVVNPGENTFRTMRPMIAEAYEIAVKRYGKKANTRKPIE
jgi:hypothetical protein